MPPRIDLPARCRRVGAGHQPGAEAGLHVREGMWHSFFSGPGLPGSAQAYRTIVAFFERHLAPSQLTPSQEEARP